MRGRGRRGGTITGFLMSVKQGFLYPAASSQFFFFFSKMLLHFPDWKSNNFGLKQRVTFAQGTSEVMKNRASLGVFSMVMGLF